MPSVALYTPPSSQSLVSWVGDFTATAAIANGLARTAFIPDSLIVKVNGVVDLERTSAQVTAAIMTGRELHLEPMAALRSIDIIKGVPALRALTLRALVLRAGHEMWVEESNDTRAIVAGRRAGSDHVQTSLWTIDRARRLNLAARDQWRNQPQNMLVARATAECARLIAADVLLGLPYTAEELADGYSDTDIPISAPAATTEPRRARRKPREVITAELPPGENETSGAAVDGSPPTVDAPGGETPTTGSDDTPVADPVVGPAVAPEPADLPADDLATITARARAEAQEAIAAETRQPDDDGPEMISRGQMTMMQATFNALGITERADRLAMTSTIVGRQLGSSLELTKAEASRLLDELPEMAGERLADDPTPGIDEPPL